MIVEILLYSGRRNPRWFQDFPMLDKVLDALPEYVGSDTSELRPSLGYQGIQLSNQRDGESWREIRIYHQHIVVEHRNGERHLWDADRSLERLILENIPESNVVLDSRIAQRILTDN